MADLNRRIYRFFLWLYPADFRAQHGEELEQIYAWCLEIERGRRGMLPAGIRALVDSIRGALALRRRVTPDAGNSVGSSTNRRRRWNQLTELGWAWRGVRARGARAWLVIGLLSIALAATTLTFAVADSLVFHRLPFPLADDIIEIRTLLPGGKVDWNPTAAMFDEWRRQNDLFSHVGMYRSRQMFVVTDRRAELVFTAYLTPGFVELLGVGPRWGRPLAPSDAQDMSLAHALISEALARQRFGEPERALGRTIETTTEPLLIVGVMPASFRFPTVNTEIWIALDPLRPPTRGVSTMSLIARKAPPFPRENLAPAMAQRSRLVGEAAGRSAGDLAQPVPISTARPTDAARTLFLALLGAAACLLLTACANVASLELAGALQRARRYAVQLALGASRLTLARVAMFEGAFLIGGAAIVAIGLTSLGLTGIEAFLPENLRLSTANPIDVDGRVFLAMLAASVVTWLIVSLPIVVYVSRSSLVGLLKMEDRATVLSRSAALVRRTLTTIEVALAVVLVIGSVLYVRSYDALLSVDRGFDSTNLVSISYTIPIQYYAGLGEIDALSEAILTRVRSVPGVLGAVHEAPPPSGPRSTRAFGLKIEVDGGPPGPDGVTLDQVFVDPEFFRVFGLRLRDGRVLRPEDRPTEAMVSQAFADRFWPGISAVGHAFRARPSDPWLEVVGIVGEMRMSARPSPYPVPSLHVYMLRQLSPSATPPATTSSWRSLDITVRMDSSARAGALLTAARTIDPRLQVWFEMVDARYAEGAADVLLATRVVSVFGSLAFLVAIVGVYGVMAFLVAGRTREIGIRIALGAQRRDISRLVLSSSLKMIAAGAVLGMAAAIVASRWVAAQFWGIKPTDPATYFGVVALIVGTAVLATFVPARRAATTDPAGTLRNE